MTIDELRKCEPEMLQRVLDCAVDTCWGYIECSSVAVLDGEAEWMDLDDDFDDLEFEIGLLKDMGLLEIHPNHPAWVREIPI